MCIITTMAFFTQVLSKTSSLYAQLESQSFLNVWDWNISAWYFRGEITLQFFHIIFQRCCFGCLTNPAVTVFHSSQACICLFMNLFTYSKRCEYISPFYMHSCGCNNCSLIFLFYIFFFNCQYDCSVFALGVEWIV